MKCKYCGAPIEKTAAVGWVHTPKKNGRYWYECANYKADRPVGASPYREAEPTTLIDYYNQLK